MKSAAAIAFAVLVVIGCSQPPDEATVGPTRSTEPPTMQAPVADSSGVDLAALKADYDKTKLAYSAKATDAKAKSAYLASAVKYAHESMMSAELDPKVKYRQALTIYREVLKIDPTNEVAKPESELIIKIYKSMGRPVPDK